MKSDQEFMEELDEQRRADEEAEERRKQEERAILEEQFRELKQDKEVIELATKPMYELFASLNELLKRIAAVDTDQKRQRYILGQLLTWSENQTTIEDKKRDLKDIL